MIAHGSYRDWRVLPYEPVLAAHYPESLVELLPPRARVLEIGCHDGIVTCYLARRRPDVTICGVDINHTAIDAARARALDEGLVNVRFETCDVIADAIGDDRFDAIVTIRLLTCFPRCDEWRRLLGAIRRLLVADGTWFGIDYLYDPTNDAYRGRYAAAEEAQWRLGNFQVHSPAGRPLFVAHHHTDGEIAFLSRIFSVRNVRRFQSLSMHGNRASMFEIVGVKPAEAR